MKRFLIEEAKRAVTKGGLEWEDAPASVVVSVKYKDDAAVQWLNMVEFEGVPNVFLSDRDIFEKLVEEDFEDQAFACYLDTHFIEEFNGIVMGEYAAVFDAIASDPENEAIPLIRYMILLARNSADEAEAFIEMAAGKYADEIEIPESDVEREHRGEVDYSFLDTLDEESLYRLLLTLQTDSASVSVFHDIDPEGFAEEKDQLAVVLERCKDQAAFETWKKAFISEEYEKQKNQEFITCKYVFVNMGQYETTIPASGKETFLEWINGSGAGFFESDREATEEEIKQYIALHAADHLE